MSRQHFLDGFCWIELQDNPLITNSWSIVCWQSVSTSSRILSAFSSIGAVDGCPELGHQLTILKLSKPLVHLSFFHSVIFLLCSINPFATLDYISSRRAPFPLNSWHEMKLGRLWSLSLLDFICIPSLPPCFRSSSLDYLFSLQSF